MKHIHPLGNRVLVRRSEARTAKGGILLPDSAQQKQKQGSVIAVGSGKTDDDGVHKPVAVSVGDTVLFGAYAGTEVKSDETNTEYLILSEDEILAILGE